MRRRINWRQPSRSAPFFGDDSVGYMDVALGSLVSWVYAGEKLYGFRLFDAARSPLLNAWLERFVRRARRGQGGAASMKILKCP